MLGWPRPAQSLIVLSTCFEFVIIQTVFEAAFRTQRLTCWLFIADNLGFVNLRPFHSFTEDASGRHRLIFQGIKIQASGAIQKKCI
jgi:hypothetical protein